MNFKITLVLVVATFCLFCGVLVVKSGLFENDNASPGCILLQNTAGDASNDANVPALKATEPEPTKAVTFTAENAEPKTVKLGSIDKKSGYKFELELTSKGAAVKHATFSEFDDRNYKNPQPFTILSPIELSDSGEILTLTNTNFIFVKQEMQLPLSKLNWKGGTAATSADGVQTARWEAEIISSEGQGTVKLVKTYRVFPNRYDYECELTVKNISAQEQRMRFDLTGPVGISKELDRTDSRTVVGGFKDIQGQVVSMSFDLKTLLKARSAEERRIIKPGGNFLWAALTDKYFTAILVPVPDKGKDLCDWAGDQIAEVYPSPNEPGNEGIGVDFRVASNTYSPAGQQGSSKTYNFRMYLGPKDKRVFDKNEYYSNLGFMQTINFMPCFCCPTWIIYPLAFGILASMEWMYRFIPNYGIVIIILVFLIRLVLHPLTKKSQVAMSKMSKLGPKIEELKKKYADNKAELNKHTMALYKEQGASPIMGIIPMFVQMPIWIALYSAIYASVALRGAPFLPVWITDLSAPDALIRFPAITIPVVGWVLDSLNLLPILMGVAFYLQQKLTPTQASADPQVAQQQKLMMIMMPLMFPLMLYKGPSGLNLYIMASTFAGVIEQYVIKKHIQEKEQEEASGLVDVTSKTGGKIKKKKPKPFFKF